MRGTPHVHSLVWIENDGITEESVNSEDIAEQNKVINLIKKTVTAILVDSVDNEVEIQKDGQTNIDKEKKYNWMPNRLLGTSNCRDFRLSLVMDLSRSKNF